MPETQAAETQITSSTQAATTTQETQTQSETLSPYDKIVKEYFSEITGETPETSTQTQADSGVERAFSALQSELTAIKQSLAVKGEKPAPVSSETKDEFLDLYARGDKQGAREALIREMAPQIKAELSRSVSQDVIRATRAEQDIINFGEKLKSENPDLVPFERAISLEARDLVQQAVNSKVVQTVEEYVSASKRALQFTVDAYKKRTLALKGEGKTEAQTRTQQVVASGAIQPGRATTPLPSGNSQEPDVSAQSYLARRREKNLAGRGIGYGSN